MKLDFNFALRAPSAPRPRSNNPFKVLILADLGGRGNREPPGTLDGRRPRALDVDNFDQRLREVAPRVEFGAPGEAPVTLTFTDLDDFHPDAIFRRVEGFEATRETRRRLHDPKTAAAAAAALRADSTGLMGGPAAPPTAPSSPPAEPEDALFDRLLGAPRSTGATGPATPPSLDRFLRAIIGPYLTPGLESDHASLVASVDAAIGDLMRRILHTPAFQQVESLWRGLRETVARVETAEDLQLFAVDITREELRLDLELARDDLSQSALHRWAVREVESPDAEPWSLIVGHYTFGAPPADASANPNEDAVFLARIGAIAARAHAPFISAIDSHWIGCHAIAEAPDPRDWAPVDPGYQALRAAPMAPWIGLALPRVLLRLPYGKDADAIDSFAFEELTGASPHEDYLWGNPALACATLLAQSFRERGGSVDPGMALDLVDLPAHTRRRDGETHMQPCAEVALPEKTVEALLARGVIPVVSFARQNRARVVRFQNIADPPTPLPISGS